jgi:hypothetical protein
VAWSDEWFARASCLFTHSVMGCGASAVTYSGVMYKVGTKFCVRAGPCNRIAVSVYSNTGTVHTERKVILKFLKQRNIHDIGYFEQPHVDTAVRQSFDHLTISLMLDSMKLV